MDDSADDHHGGYGRPPKKNRYKKGQSGNQGRHFRRRRNPVDWLEKLLLKLVEITLDGETRKITTLQAIVMGVSLKAVSGDRRARALLLKFKAFATRNSDQKLDVVFVDDDYTRALAKRVPAKGNDNE